MVVRSEEVGESTLSLTLVALLLLRLELLRLLLIVLLIVGLAVLGVSGLAHLGLLLYNQSGEGWRSAKREEGRSRREARRVVWFRLG